MAENSKIEWTDHTFNPWLGCTKVSPGCDGCYAEAMMDHRYGRVKWGAGQPRVRTSVANWRKPLAWNKAAASGGKPVYVFCASLSDVFDNEVDPQWRTDLMELIEATPNLTWLLLTKRIGNVLKMIDRLPANAAIGATMVDQAEYDRDSGKLQEVSERLGPAFTFGSFEPLLGPITMHGDVPDWIIVGGETDQGKHKARIAETDWFRSMRDQSAMLEVAFFMKQMPRKAPIPADLLIRQFPKARAA
ncbi:DUF5131 family protein [Parvibaculum sp.]|uniref:DUF5131 family protein n=1 Tax=Parvibaculum sp. TaxID=2024848 RepID=UPI001D3E8EA5|nr:DUF5131 family protein [Parvibaculum sp.]MBX3490844.1 DUF5131 family protein [Parvibaculum sp.]